MPDFMKVMQQAQEMQERMQEDLATVTVTGSAGAGMVTVEADGKGAVKKVKIDPSVVNPADVEMLEDLVAVAVGDAQRKAGEAAQAQMRKMMGGLSLPFKLPF